MTPDIYYPDEYKIDIIRDSREFHSLFLGVEIFDVEMKKINTDNINFNHLSHY